MSGAALNEVTNYPAKLAEAALAHVKATRWKLPMLAGRCLIGAEC